MVDTGNVLSNLLSYSPASPSLLNAPSPPPLLSLLWAPLEPLLLCHLGKENGED